MKLGIMSDSHGHVQPVRQALQLLDEAGADTFIHCGDVGGMEVIDELAGRRGWFVWGNTDIVDERWRRQVEALGLPWPNGGLELTLAGKHIAVFHGHEREFGRTLHAAKHDYLLHGHSHRRTHYHQGTMQVINPGALHRASVKSVALLDLDTDQVQFIEIERARSSSE
jgi:putative phosphoesterase